MPIARQKFVVVSLLLLACLSSGYKSIGQATFNLTWQQTGGYMVNVKALYEYSLLHPDTFRFSKYVEEPELREPKRRPPATKGVHDFTLKTDQWQTGNPSPAPAAQFAAIDFDGYFPPDSYGSTNGGQVATTVNDHLIVQSVDGSVEADISLYTLWSKFNPGEIFDPRIRFDIYTGQWYIAALVNPESEASSLLMGISQNSSPAGNWAVYEITADPSRKYWADYTDMGFNNQWIAVHTNMFGLDSATADTGRIFLFDKRSLLDSVVSYATITCDAGICPAATFDNSVSDLFLLESWNGQSGQVYLQKLTGSSGTVTLNPVGYPAISSRPWNYSSTDFNIAPQLSDTAKINCNDDRIQNLIYQNGSLWATQNVFYSQGSNSYRVAAQWWQIDTDATVKQAGVIDDPTGNYDYAFPCIAVNNNNDALIGFSVFAAGIYASAGYSYHYHNSANSAVNNPVIYRQGENTYLRADNANRNRWGDYSATVVDPSNTVDFWTVQEYATSNTNIWGTCWAKVSGSDTSVTVEATGTEIIPNPNIGSFSVYFTGQIFTPVQVKITDMMGRQVYTGSFESVSATNSVSIATYLAGGCYLLQANANNRTTVNKLIVASVLTR